MDEQVAGSTFMVRVGITHVLILHTWLKCLSQAPNPQRWLTKYCNNSELLWMKATAAVRHKIYYLCYVCNVCAQPCENKCTYLLKGYLSTMHDTEGIV